MQAKLITEEHREAWNALAAREPSFAMLQSWEWGEFKASLGWRPIRVGVESGGRLVAGAQMLIKAVPLGVASVAYVPRGPIGAWLDWEVGAALFALLHQIARAHGAVFLKIEPPVVNNLCIEAQLKDFGFQPSAQRNQPRATLILDLCQDTELIFKNLRKKTRQYINNSERAGVTVRIGGEQDLPAFINLIEDTGRREHFPIHPHAYYEQEWRVFVRRQEYALLLAEYQGQIIAARTVHRFGSHAAEFHAGSLDQFSHVHANYLMAWSAIRWAHKAGCCTYDLWGIPDEIAQTGPDPNPQAAEDENGLWGVYQFKRGFTKNITCYAGAFDFIYRRSLYRLLMSRFFTADRLAQAAVLLDYLK